MDYSTMKNRQLADECRHRGLATYGSRAALLTRLNTYDSGQTPPIPTEQENPTMGQIVAGPDSGPDSGNDLLDAVNPPPTPEPAPVPAPPLDPRDQQILDLRAELLQMQAAQAAKPGARPTAGEVAGPGVIAAANNREQVFQAEFALIPGMELADGIHETFMRQCTDQAVAAGFRTRGGAHRIGWGEKDGQRTAVYEIYVRPRQ